jgi:hypothetical protein
MVNPPGLLRNALLDQKVYNKEAVDGLVQRYADRFVGACYYGESTTAAVAADKAVTLAPGSLTSPLALNPGTQVYVRFNPASTAAIATLAVGGTAAKTVCLPSGSAPAATECTSANKMYHFLYDGTNWRLMNGDVASQTKPMLYNITGTVQGVTGATPSSSDFRWAFNYITGNPWTGQNGAGNSQALFDWLAANFATGSFLGASGNVRPQGQTSGTIYQLIYMVLSPSATPATLANTQLQAYWLNPSTNNFAGRNMAFSEVAPYLNSKQIF